MKHMAGVELAAGFLTKPITVGATWSRFRRFAGLYDMAEPEDLEILKKIGICREWALKGLTVAVELEKWKPTTEEHHRIRKLGICAVATGVCHVVQKWKSHLCCLKRKSRTPRENEPGIGTQSTETRWPRENEPGPNHQMLRENEPSIKKTLQPQGPTSFGEFDFGKSFFGDSVVGGTCDNNLSGEGAQVFNSGVTAARFRNHCPLGCPRVGRSVLKPWRPALLMLVVVVEMVLVMVEMIVSRGTRAPCMTTSTLGKRRKEEKEEEKQGHKGRAR